MPASTTVVALFAPNKLIGAIRALVIDDEGKAKSGITGTSMGMAEIQVLTWIC
ncbi:MAG: hypothetical protein WAO76_01275 [Georgfuchsia sp.]